jgi:HAD superfamily hydrolase (TIGR01458 family)
MALPSGLAGLMLDLDGVLYVEDEPVPGAVEAVRRLRERGLALRFVTNTTSRPRRQILARLTRLGCEVPPDELLTPAALAVRYCRDRGHERVALVMNEAVREDFAALVAADDDDVDAVIIGDCGDAFGYAVLNRAFRHVMGGAELIALQKNRYWRTPDGLSLDVGPFVAALEYATDRDAVVIGKPAPEFFASALAGMALSAEQVAMVGDDVESDIGGALSAGLAGILVRTGKFRAEALRRATPQPTAVVESIADVPSLLE